MVFFSHSPPYMLRNALGNVFVAGTIFAVLTYVTLYQNQTIGVMLILAFLITMTQVTEHLTGDGTPPAQQGTTPPAQQGSTPPAPTNIPVPPPPPASSSTSSCPPGYNYAGGSNTCIPTGGGAFVCPSGSTRYTGRNGEKGCVPNDRVQEGVSSGQITIDSSSPAAPALAAPAPIATPATTSAPTAPATPPPAAAAPAPVMSCNIESFASF